MAIDRKKFGSLKRRFDAADRSIRSKAYDVTKYVTQDMFEGLSEDDAAEKFQALWLAVLNNVLKTLEHARKPIGLGVKIALLSMKAGDSEYLIKVSPQDFLAAQNASFRSIFNSLDSFYPQLESDYNKYKDSFQSAVSDASHGVELGNSALVTSDQHFEAFKGFVELAELLSKRSDLEYQIFHLLEDFDLGLSYEQREKLKAETRAFFTDQMTAESYDYRRSHKSEDRKHGCVWQYVRDKYGYHMAALDL